MLNVNVPHRKIDLVPIIKAYAYAHGMTIAHFVLFVLEDYIRRCDESGSMRTKVKLWTRTLEQRRLEKERKKAQE